MNAANYNPYGAPHGSNDELNKKVTAIFSIKEGVGTLASCLNILKEHNLNLTRIESRPSLQKTFDYDFFVEFSPEAKVDEIEKVSRVLVEANVGCVSLITKSAGMEWFPRKMRDLDFYTTKNLDYSDQLQTDHPGFKDEEYKARRQAIVQIARSYKAGEKIPEVEYNESEKATWKSVYLKLRDLYKTHACSQMNRCLSLLEHNLGFGPDNIPQLQKVSDYLHDVTGWRLRPVMGLLTSREFLNGLAFRVFHSTQYMRHPSQPFYTPEPDVIHDVLGHVPLFSDPEFSDLSQEIGLASLGVSDEDINKLSTIYWFSVEFGLCKEKGQLKAYGAGLLSSYGELTYCLSSEPKHLPFEPSITCKTEYPITKYQPQYFVTESFDDAKQKVRDFARTLERPFTVRYNPFTENIEILDRKETILHMFKSIQSELRVLSDAFDKIL